MVLKDKPEVEMHDEEIAKKNLVFFMAGINLLTAFEWSQK